MFDEKKDIQDTSKPTTQVGKTVLRSLTTVKNKIKSPDTTQEAQFVFSKWINSFVTELKGDSRFHDFLSECGKSFGNTQQQPATGSGDAATPPPPSGRGRARGSQTSQAEES